MYTFEFVCSETDHTLNLWSLEQHGSYGMFDSLPGILLMFDGPIDSRYVYSLKRAADI